jgi:superfamily II DNA or RNA helicase
MSVELRQYQKDILNCLWKSLMRNNKVLLSAPTGS